MRIALAALTLAGIADAVTYALTPAAVAAHDLSPIAQLGGLWLAVAVKALAVCAAWFVLLPVAQSLGPRAMRLALTVPLAGAALWGFGAWANVVYGWR